MIVFTGDFKTQFEQETTKLIGEQIESRELRMVRVKALCDMYLEQIGDNPEARQIERLTDYILMEEIADRNPDKISENEYPFFSNWQLDQRDRQRVGSEVIDIVGTDGIVYNKPGRKKRTAYEYRLIDEAAATKNKARKAQYKADTEPGEIVSYNLADNPAPPINFSQSRGVLSFYSGLEDRVGIEATTK